MMTNYNARKLRHSANQHGFTLIEILIVVAIASILSMISVPFYQNYTIRAKVTGELPLIDPVVLRMNEEFVLNDTWPSSNEEAGVSAPEQYQGKYLQSVEISDSPQAGTVTLTYNSVVLPALLGSNTLVFYPQSAGSGGRWACDQGTIPSKFRPSRCRQ